ncbi:serine dehydratase subunit alpha family protein [Candidatus Gracilibacteria bacterium]|nr:serine dehydratase subunit alpha family protein [Candidatus Gracilibacteria bacterium]
MNSTLYKEISKKEIFPALGCTEPIAIAYAVSRANEYINTTIANITITLDAGTHKNSIGVIIPNSGNNKGTNIAAALGIYGDAKRGLEVLYGLGEDKIQAALDLDRRKIINTHINEDSNLYIKAEINTIDKKNVVVVIKSTHTNIVSILVDNVEQLEKENVQEGATQKLNYQDLVRSLTIKDMLDLAKKIDDSDINQIKQGISMQLAIGEELRTSFPDEYEKLRSSYSGLLYSNQLAEILLLCTSATYARMSGVNKPVMSSGGSGNQGIVAMLLPYLYGIKVLGIGNEDRKLYESIALSNIVNSYVKCYTGAISSMCGCYIAAGTGAIAGMLYQGDAPEKNMHFGISNMVASSGGVLCDGAKIGCYNKVAASVVNSINAVSQANQSFGVTNTDGIIGRDGLESIRNISQIANEGGINKALIPILRAK